MKKSSLIRWLTLILAVMAVVAVVSVVSNIGNVPDAGDGNSDNNKIDTGSTGDSKIDAGICVHSNQISKISDNGNSYTHIVRKICTSCAEIVSTKDEMHRFSGGVCTVCGRECIHAYANGTGSCTICGYSCSHDWRNGVCVICGATCAHTTFNNGKCANCGYACTHGNCDYTILRIESLDSTSHCVYYLCDHCNGIFCYEFDHEFEDDGCDKVCTYCGFVQYGIHEYPAVYTDGECTKCGKVCTHETVMGGDQVGYYCGTCNKPMSSS